ncbi:MAG: calcium/sodium antiporter [Prevotella sp.]|nr:calcium/sodium antiporter [Prevotella sp.]
MIVHILFIILGIYIVIRGADFLTDGAVAIAERANIPQIIIGLTIVAMGTSMPEFCVSFMSALKGTSDIAVGNVIGSNIFNTLLIVGSAAAIAPIAIAPVTIRRDVPVSILASIALIILIIDGRLSRIDAAIILILFIAFMALTLRGAKDSDEETAEKKNYSIWKSIALVAAGLLFLIVGSNVFVDHAVEVARKLNVSDAIIGLTIVAGGTSMPELATSIVAARKGNSGIAIGNVLGSNVFNILFILSITGLVCPMTISGITPVDMAMLVGSVTLLWLFAASKLRIERWEAFVLLAIFIAYMGYLIKSAV